MIVPDSIEPIIGYKWVRTYKDHLYSGPHERHQWPQMAPFKAVCAIDRGWSYQPRPYWEVRPGPKKPKKHSLPTPVNTTASVATPTNHWGWAPDSSTYAKKPKLALVYPLDWSWEQVMANHESPDEDCSCGIYVVNNQGECNAYNYSHTRMVLIEVALWGKVVVGEGGARGQFAYPRRIVQGNRMVHRSEVALLRTKYGIEEEEPEPKPEAKLNTTIEFTEVTELVARLPERKKRWPW